MREVFEHPDTLQITKKIDEGGFAIVVQARDAQGNLFAIKRVKAYATISKKPTAYARKICREVAILTLLNQAHCDYIVPLHQVYLSEDKRDCYMVMPFIPLNLDYVMREFRNTEREIKVIAYKLLAGIKHCHDRKIIHRDLSPRNVLLDEELKLYVADFGLARAKEDVEEEGTLGVVTLEFRPPEVLLAFKCYDHRLDIWSIGVILAEMYLHRRLFAPEHKDAPHMVRKIIQLLGAPDLAVVDRYSGRGSGGSFVRDVTEQLRQDGLLQQPFESISRDLAAAGASPEAIDLIRWMLQFDFTARCTAGQALDHRWFADDPEYATGDDDDDDVSADDAVNTADVAVPAASAAAATTAMGGGDSVVSSEAAPHTHEGHNKHQHQATEDDEQQQQQQQHCLEALLVDADGAVAAPEAASSSSLPLSSSPLPQSSPQQSKEDEALVGSSWDVQEDNKLMRMLQVAKLAELTNFMESIAANDVRLVRGEYEDDNDAAMVFENSSPTD